MKRAQMKRCPHCGRAESTWTRPKIIGALQAFHAEHGRAPHWDEWKKAGPDHPSASSVRQVFGGLPAAIREAGFESPPRRNQHRHWTKKLVAQAVFEFVYEHGHPPTSTDWLVASERNPSKTIVQRMFGSWNTMLEELGYPLTRRSDLTRQQVYARRATEAARKTRVAA